MTQIPCARERLARLLREWCAVYGADLPCMPREALGAPVFQETGGLERLALEVEACRACPLGNVRRRSVPGEGPTGSWLMMVGGSPGLAEERAGHPFQAEEGLLLTRMLERGMGVPRGEAFLTTVVKCRPPGDRDPQPEERKACEAFLVRQVGEVRPKVVLALGRVAASALLGKGPALPVLRGQVFRWQGVPLVVTWDLAYLIHHPKAKLEAWQDLKLAMKLAGRTPPGTATKREDP